MGTREFPEWPLVGVGGVLIDQGRALLVRRAREPALGEWTIPGGLLEVGETLAAAVERELREETGLIVRVVELIEALERIFSDSEEITPGANGARVRSSQEVPRALGERLRPQLRLDGNPRFLGDGHTSSPKSSASLAAHPSRRSSGSRRLPTLSPSAWAKARSSLSKFRRIRSPAPPRIGS